jgi:hypothetical protein
MKKLIIIGASGAGTDWELAPHPWTGSPFFYEDARADTTLQRQTASTGYGAELIAKTEEPGSR